MTEARLEELKRRLDLEIPRHAWDGADVSVYRDFVARNEWLVSFAETGKNNEQAEKFRLAGNRAFAKELFEVALGQYNWCLCYATDPEQLSFAYGNRSVVYYEMGEYEFALYNIDLAKAHNYPERLMPKLLAREVNCKRAIKQGLSHGTVPHPMVEINVEVNPRIPFLAKGIVTSQPDEDEHRKLVAERDFNTGDVILNEKIDLCVVMFKKGNSYCAHCGSEFRYSLIPCPGCVIVMYCEEKCRKENFRTVHRFGVLRGDETVERDRNKLFDDGEKLFFTGLTAFNDNITEMMEYCLPNAAIGSNPLDLDFSNSNPLDVFKSLHQTKPRSTPFSEHMAKLYSAIYSAIFLKNPLVQAIVRTEAQRDFLLRCLVTHSRVSLSTMSTDKNFAILPVITNVFKHSCDPNVLTVIDSGKIKMIVLRPLKTGDRIFTAYGPAWWNIEYEVGIYGCDCVVCDRGPEGAKWRATRNQDRPMSPEVEQGLLGLERMTMDITTGLVKFQRIVQLMALEGHHPGKTFGRMVSAYLERLTDFVEEQNVKRDRAKLLHMRGDVVVSGMWDV